VQRAKAARLVKAGIGNPEATVSLEDPLRRRVTGNFIVAVLLTTFMGFSSWRSVQVAANDADWMVHTYDVIQRLKVTLQHVTEVETSARMFALVGQAPLLAHYETVRDSIAQDEEALRHLTADNPHQQRRLDVLESQIRAEVELAARMVAKRQQGNTAAGAGELLETESLMGAVRATTEEMQAGETQLLSQRTEKTKSGRWLASFFMAAGVVVGVGLLAVAKFAIKREIAGCAGVWAQLKALNADLEQRVDQRTAALQSQSIERERAEQKLRQGEEMFRLLLDGIKDYAIYMLDPTGKVNSWNAGAARIKGYRSEDILGKDFCCFYRAEEVEAGKPARDLQEAVSRGRFEEQAWRVRKDGSVFWAHVVITPMYDDSGTLRGFSKVARDISERKEAEERLGG
jgi:PAS domain S-box-containing protein